MAEREFDADIIERAQRLEAGTAYGSIEQLEAIAFALQAERDRGRDDVVVATKRAEAAEARSERLTRELEALRVELEALRAERKTDPVAALLDGEATPDESAALAAAQLESEP